MAVRCLSRQRRAVQSIATTDYRPLQLGGPTIDKFAYEHSGMNAIVLGSLGGNGSHSKHSDMSAAPSCTKHDFTDLQQSSKCKYVLLVVGYIWPAKPRTSCSTDAKAAETLPSRLARLNYIIQVTTQCDAAPAAQALPSNNPLHFTTYTPREAVVIPLPSLMACFRVIGIRGGELDDA